MSCEEYIINLTSQRHNGTNSTEPDNLTKYVHLIFLQIGLPIVLVFGIVGNVLNLAVLTRKQLQKSMDYMEKSAHISLTALALSDMLFCIVALPYAFIDNKRVYTSDENLLPLYYRMIHTPLFNLFILCSTWLTVFMSIARFLAICYPLQARIFISLRGTKVGILVVALASIGLNMPRFWHYKLESYSCADECTCYEKKPTELFTKGKFDRTYQIIWAVLGVLIPLVALIFCNICLIRALRNSTKVQHRYRANKAKQPSHRVTPTLIAIIVLFLVLVCPSEIINAIAQFHSSVSAWQPYRVVAMISNFMMACNFAVNFVLYCIINKHFRKTVRSIICLTYCRGQGQVTGGIQNTQNMTMLTDMDATMDATNL